VQIGGIIETMVAGDAGKQGLVHLAVVQADHDWRIFLNDRKVGRFTRRTDAVQCALDIARQGRGDGFAVEVLTHNRFGEVSHVADHPLSS
jgi:hypothetical protein